MTPALRITSSLRAALLLSGFAACLLAGTLAAQEVTPPGPLEDDPVRLQALMSTAKKPWEDYDKHLQSRKALTAHGPDLFGDNVNLYNGALSFSVTDISLPGNSSLPVALTRTFSVGAYPVGKPMDGAFGDWDIDIPRIEGVYGPTWAGNRCSRPTPGLAYSGGTEYTDFDYWQGLHARMPGGGELLVADTGSPEPTDGNSWDFLTPGFTYVRCITLPAGSNTTGEGFEALTADGTKYTFAHMAQTFETPLASPMNSGTGGSGSLIRKRNALYVTRIEDRFGHRVNYTYAPGQTATSPVQLENISASDGRQISVTYTNGRITSATAHGRDWIYGYDQTTFQNASLASVRQPDDSRWQLSLRALSTAEIEYSQDEGQRNCSSSGIPIGPTSVQGTVTHPAGATGTFVMTLYRHGRSNVSRICVNWDAGNTNPSDDVAKIPKQAWVFAISSKTVTGPGLDTAAPSASPVPLRWNYSFISEATWACANDNPPFSTGTCPATIQPLCTSDSCAGKAIAIVTGPNNDWRRYTFGNSYRYDEGLLRKVEHGTDPSNILHIETTTYQLAQSGQPYALPRGRSLPARGDGFINEQPRPRIQHTTVREFDSFTWTGSQFDAFARPTVVTRASSIGHSRTETLTYHDNTARWVLGQLQKTQVGSEVPQETTYDSTTALPTHSYAFGKLQSRRTYHTTTAQAGLVHEIFDGGDINRITLNNYKRGIPESVSLPTSASMVAEVNDLGEITQVTDATGASTVYAYDNGGRISQITPPGQDVQPWLSTSITYEPVNAVEYGLPAGHWRRVEVTGTRRHETFYDALWRPVLTRQASTDGSVGSRSVRRHFDHEGREVFASYPVDTLNTPALDALTALTQGLRTRYDVLGRVTGTTQDSELGQLTTSTVYQTPLTTVFTDARNFSTTTTYQAFDQPSHDAPLTISAPEGLTTTFTRDIYGKPLTLTRSGSFTPAGAATESLSLERRYVYDLHQRLCKTVETDAGVTVWDYDAAGNVAWRATAQNALTAPQSCQHGAVVTADRSVHHYDALNRLLFIDHPTNTDDVGYTYEPDGALATATVGVLNPQASAWTSTRNRWTYTYNRRGLLESETLQVFPENRSFALDWSYNTRGDLAGLVYPSGLSLDFNPNAFGEPRQAGSFATAASYHPSGRVVGFNYGNGVARALTLNSRQLPQRIHDQRSGMPVLDHTLTYDSAGNLKSITDGVPGGLESRTLHYDGRNRLTSITASPQGNESYVYDPLDNVRQTVQAGTDRRFHYAPSTQRLEWIRTPTGQNLFGYQWNPRGEMTRRTQFTQGIPPINPPTIFRSGFESGLLESPTDFQFDRANRLTGSHNGQIAHLYDAHGRRVRTSQQFFGTRFEVYSQSGQLLYVEDGPTNTRHDYIQFNGQLVAERQQPLNGGSATTSYLHSDLLGSLSVKTANQGSVVYRSRYQAFGAPLDGWRDGPGYTKHVMDSASELVYMQQRYYDPATLRFISTDPVSADPLNFNRYWYANNNPYKYTDPDGRLAWFVAVPIVYGITALLHSDPANAPGPGDVT
ncbi:MAG: RHS repeat domain-containing protein, partial [Lysobacterales bacterium]